MRLRGERFETAREAIDVARAVRCVPVAVAGMFLVVQPLVARWLSAACVEHRRLDLEP